jgi:hypothetical protein
MAVRGAPLRLARFRARFKHFTGTGSAANGGAAGAGCCPCPAAPCGSLPGLPAGVGYGSAHCWLVEAWHAVMVTRVPLVVESFGSVRHRPLSLSTYSPLAWWVQTSDVAP